MIDLCDVLAQHRGAKLLKAKPSQAKTSQSQPSPVRRAHHYIEDDELFHHKMSFDSLWTSSLITLLRFAEADISPVNDHSQSV